MPDRDTWVRITLRMPQELHRKLTGAAGAKSLNAEIVDRLESSFAALAPVAAPNTAEADMIRETHDMVARLLQGLERGEEWKTPKKRST